MAAAAHARNLLLGLQLKCFKAKPDLAEALLATGDNLSLIDMSMFCDFFDISTLT